MCAKTARILLANLLQGSRSTFARVRFPSFFAFQDGMWDTQFSALLSSPTVSLRILLANLLQSSRSTSLGEVSPAFLPSEQACWTHKFRHLGVGQQYPKVFLPTNQQEGHLLWIIGAA